ncbi:MAG: carboxypeptidase regulatory-like domain-containing protein [Terracidiphilus sp.]
MALLLMLSSRTAFAQYDLGGLVGTIHDSSGAAVPNVTVTVTNDATGIATVVKTDQSGDYEVPSLRVGVYTISASASGFAIAEAKSITISVGARVRIDLVLKVGTAQATTVEVSDVALQLQTESSQRDQTITNYQTESLPLVSRTYSDLVNYVVGAHQAPADATVTSVTSFTRAGSFNVNGQRSMFNDYMIDGMDNNSYGESNQGFDNQIIQPPPDSVANFEVITNNESAEYGRSSGATVNVASKSGTNEFHTTLYEFIRNTDLNAFGYIKPLTYNAAGNPYPFFKPVFDRNQFGANFGGPIIKDRFFWFLDYEGLRQTLTPTVVDTVPTLDELSGVLAVPVQDPWSPTTSVSGGSAATQQQYVPALAAVTGINTSGMTPWTTQALADLDPTAVTIAKLYMQALPAKCQVTSAGTSSGVATNNCPLNAPFTDHADKGDLRFDFQQNANTSWFLKVSDRKEVGKNYNLLPEPIDMQTNGHILIHDEQIAAGYNHAFSANKFLDARLALSETRAGKWTFAIGSTAFPAGTIPGLPTIAGVSGGLPSIAISGGFTSFGRQSTNPQWQNPSLVDPKVNFSWVKGKHSLKFGYEWEKVFQEIQDSNPLYGSFTYGGGDSVCTSASGCSGTAKVGDTYFADFLFGASSAYSLATYFITHVYQTMDSAYAQDDWKVSSKLTLNVGLRWEYGSPWTERNNYISNFNPATGGMLTLTPGFTATTAGGYNNNGMCGSVACIAPYSGSGVYGKTLVHPDLTDWAPRFGFAAAITPSIVVRGGFGTAFVHYWRAGSGNNIAINAPFALYSVVSNPAVGTTNGFVRLSQGFPTGLATTFSPGTDDIDSIPPNTKDGYAESWFLDVQKSLGKNTKIDFAYVANHGVHLQGFINANQKNPALPLTTTGQFSGIAANQFQRPYMGWGGYLLNNSTTYPTFSNGDITQALSEFHSSYNALQARYQQQYAGGLTLLNSFTWSHDLDNASSTLEANTPCPQNGDNIEADYGQSDYNLPITNVTTLVYELPFGQGRRFLNGANPVTNAILGGWQISAVNTMDAGTPFNLTYSPASANAVSPQLTQNWRGENLYRPNLVPGVPYLERVPALTGFTSGAPSGKLNGYVQYINPAAIAFPSTYTTGSALTTGGTISSPFGNLPKNFGRTPAYYETDLDFNKKFNTPIERVKIEFRSELYNILNHTNLYLPGGSGGGTASGTDNNLPNTVSALGGGQVTGTFEPRIVQFGLKVTY